MNILKWLQFTTIALSPLYIIRGHFFIPTTFLEVLILLTLFVFIILFIKEGKNWKLLRTKFDYLILFFLITATIAAFRNVDLISGLGILRAYFLEPILFFYTLIYTIRRTNNGRFIIFALLTSGIWLVFLSILQKVTGSFTLAPYEIALGRVPAVYNSANALALFLGPISFLSLILVFSKNGKLKLLFGLLFVIFFTTLLWTKSRGGLIAEVVGLLSFFYILISQKMKIFSKVWIILPLAIIAFSSVFFFSVYKDYSGTPLNYKEDVSDNDTLKIRYFLWVGTINMIRDNPINGAGLEGFRPLYERVYKLHPAFEAFQYPHNIFLTFWAEMGLFGLIAFLLLFVSVLSLLIKNIPNSKNPVVLSSLVAVFIYWIMHGLVDVPYFKNDLSLEFWIFLALVVFFTEKPKESI